MVLVETDLKSLVVNDAVDVGREVVQDLERQVTEGLLGALDPLARVRLGEGDTQELAGGLQLAVLAGLGDVDLSGLSKGVKVLNALLEIRVVNAGLESESVLDGTCESVEKVQGGELVQEILFAQFAVALICVNPNSAGQVLADELKLTPILPAFCVSLVGGASTERNRKTDNETKNCEQQVADVQLVHKFRDTSNRSRPKANNNQGNEHLWQDGTVHAHEEGPFRVLGHIARTNLFSSANLHLLTGKCVHTK